MTTNSERKLGPYTLVKKLGEGGMGAVYLGHHRVLEVEHAIKILPARLAQNQQFIERFLREARSAAKLHHPNIVPVVGADEDNGIRYIAMHFVRGNSLEKLARSGTMSIHDAVFYTHQIAQALAYAHSRGMIHRDVKPDNVLVDEEGVAKLTDFGLVRDMSGQAGLTQSGAVLGTPYYMSPEQWLNEGVDHRSDIYACGVMLYYMMSRKYPFPGDAPAVILRNQMGGNPPRLETVCGAADPELCAVVHHAFNTDPTQRIQSAEELCLSLENWWSKHADPTGRQLLLAPMSSTAGTIRRTAGASGVSGPPSSASDRLAPPDTARTLLTTGRPTTGNSSSSDFTPAGSGTYGANIPPPPPPQSGLQQSGIGAINIQQTATPPSQVILRDSSSGAMILGQMTESGFVPTGTLVGTPPAKSNALLIGVIAALVVVIAVIAVIVVMAGGKAALPPGPLMTLDVPPAEATMASPRVTRDTEFSIAGTAAEAVSITVNGKPYTFGNVLPLNVGENKFEIVATREDKTESRTLYVVVDREAPAVKVPLFETADANGDVFTAEREITIAGTVTDADPKVMVELVRGNAAPEMIPAGEDGTFSVTVPVGDQPMPLTVQAIDRAKNRTNPPMQINLVPDRTAPQLAWSDTSAADMWFTSRSVRLSGTVNKSRGVTVTANLGDLTLIAADRKFTMTAELEPGTHDLKITMRDALGAEATLSRKVVVDLRPPQFLELTPAANSTVQLKTLGEGVAISGRIDDPGAKLTLNGAPVTVTATGEFSAPFVPPAFGAHTVVLRAEDMAGRPIEQQLRFSIEEQLYERIGKNAQGFVEHRRLRDGMTVIEIPADTYTIGGTGNQPADAPSTRVQLSAFFIDKFEVDNAKYAAFLNAGKLTPEDVFGPFADSRVGAESTHRLEFANGEWRPKEGFERHPVTGVTWRGAQAYAKWVDPRNGDLPTEAQWEVAARGTDGRAYPWGNEEPDSAYLNFLYTGTGNTAAVDYFSTAGVSPFGVTNMAGNVEEWCLDWYSPAAYSVFSGANPRQRDRPTVSGTATRIVRGGSFTSPGEDEPRILSADDPSDMRTFVRGHRDPAKPAKDRGFRAASTRP